jgi:hypothetical protein
MRLILHAGMPKAGSSALQVALKRARRSLLRKGVLYPLTVPVSAVLLAPNHNFMVAGITSFERLPRHYRQVFAADRETLEKRFERYWKRITAQIRHHQPHTVILSGEAFSRKFTANEVTKLKTLVSPWANQIEIVFYVRRPSEYYLSSLQQRLKASHIVRSVKPNFYRRTIEQYGQIADKIHVIPCVRSTLYEGDIGADFAWRLVPDCLAEIRAAAKGTVNETLSAETMSILQSYRLHNHNSRKDIQTVDTEVLISLLGNIERGLGMFTRPKLKAGFADAIDSFFSDDLVWLESSFGVSFDGLDLARLNSLAKERISPEAVESICEVDQVKREKLVTLLIHHLIERNPFFGSNPLRRLRSYQRWLQRALF